MSTESNAYILGTEAAELHRLGIQHQVWSSEANQAWVNAGFRSGMHLLDLGCGPGFCTQELSYIAGHDGHVLGVDLSPSYIRLLEQVKELHNLNITALCSDFNDMVLEDHSLDGVYNRWSLAWLSNVEEIAQKVIKAMKPGATWAIHEYYDWSLLQFSPHMPNLYEGTRAILRNFADGGGNINIGIELAPMLSQMGMEVISTRPMTKLCRADQQDWQWPKTFIDIYLPKIVATGHLSQEECDLALRELKELEKMDGATIQCPLMIEIIARKK